MLNGPWSARAGTQGFHMQGLCSNPLSYLPESGFAVFFSLFWSHTWWHLGTLLAQCSEVSPNHAWRSYTVLGLNPGILHSSPWSYHPGLKVSLYKISFSCYCILVFPYCFFLLFLHSIEMFSGSYERNSVCCLFFIAILHILCDFNSKFIFNGSPNPQLRTY